MSKILVVYGTAEGQSRKIALKTAEHIRVKPRNKREIRSNALSLADPFMPDAIVSP